MGFTLSTFTVDCTPYCHYHPGFPRVVSQLCGALSNFLKCIHPCNAKKFIKFLNNTSSPYMWQHGSSERWGEGNPEWLLLNLTLTWQCLHFPHIISQTDRRADVHFFLYALDTSQETIVDRIGLLKLGEEKAWYKVQSFIVPLCGMYLKRPGLF